MVSDKSIFYNCAPKAVSGPRRRGGGGIVFVRHIFPTFNGKNFVLFVSAEYINSVKEQINTIITILERFIFTPSKKF